MNKFEIIDLAVNDAEVFKTKCENKEIRNVKIRIHCIECNKIVEKWPDVRRFHNWFYCPKCSTKLYRIRTWGSLDKYNEHMKKERENTLIAKYGSLKKAQEIRLENQRKYNRKVHGCDYYFQTTEFKNKLENKLTEMNNGIKTTNVSQIKEIRNKIKETNKEKYGCEEYMQSLDFKNKTIATSKSKYNTDSPNSAKIVKKHKEDSVFLKYGVTNVNQLKEVREKIYKTCMERYGKLWNTYKYKYDNIKFDSGWELIYYIWLKDHDINFKYHPKINFDYIDENGKNSKYEPDFLIDNKLYEIKGDHFFNEQKQLINPYDKNKPLCLKKQQCMIDNGVKILTSIDLKDSFDYFNTLNLNLSSFRVKRGKNENNIIK